MSHPANEAYEEAMHELNPRASSKRIWAEAEDDRAPYKMKAKKKKMAKKMSGGLVGKLAGLVKESEDLRKPGGLKRALK